MGALRGKSLSEATQLLESGVNPNCVDGEGKTPLIKASSCGLSDLVELLLRFGASTGAKTKAWGKAGGSTALHVACEGGFPEVVRALLAGKAEVNITDARGNPPLYAALTKWSTTRRHLYMDITEQMIRAKALVTVRNKSNHTASDLAKRTKDDKVVQLITAAVKL
ncbi:Ankyrin repeat domain-containing protein [Tetrabaena socialis]|uniref:Ankyrin repeat domain-containing protein n=1 Tax=Tetrabaena socialis TaxID=47790 RepID=A0A2J8A288_9CHLO|nr:Ankyrin repeat domain-containing protein [Tetrabaena socialis]|eukprot:PNH06630.1 Ankyrin repeat domain-containing protein [Tetrabaena socialis]